MTGKIPIGEEKKAGIQRNGNKKTDHRRNKGNRETGKTTTSASPLAAPAEGKDPRGQDGWEQQMEEEIEQKTMFYATAVGRATNHFFKRCYPMFSHVVSFKMDNMMLNGASGTSLIVSFFHLL
ncbi:hypothetical protein HPB47_006993 [Ixodes persulcatus]|uniref:Uncharacterized protein n=1 Tax=Ixodes persulcatus TaxID=34615 RepID=A0AC60P8U3_IXOPE|nr:hypothetical protein HPB47_006993 [Ixodes persulcatus]